MHLLIDTNVIIDYVCRRQAFDAAATLFEKVAEESSTCFVTASSVTDIFYITRKYAGGTQGAYAMLDMILAFADVLPTTAADIEDAYRKRWSDFEDAVVMAVAESNDIDYIITNNKQDFVGGIVPVLTPAEYCALQ